MSVCVSCLYESNRDVVLSGILKGNLEFFFYNLRFTHIELKTISVSLKKWMTASFMEDDPSTNWTSILGLFSKSHLEFKCLMKESLAGKST